MKFLVAVDESAGSVGALTWAVDHIIRLTGGVSDQPEQPGQLILLHVQEPVQFLIQPVGPVAAVYPPTLLAESVKKAQAENSRRVLSQAMGICRERRVNAETMELVGDVKEMICEAVDRLHPDLLVIGSRGLSTWKRAFLGSVSDYCAHHANCPVLIVKPAKPSDK